jgi:hypothetical protein
VSAVRSDLFDKPHLEGLAQTNGIITPSEEQALIASIDAVELSPFRFLGWLARRLTASYGWRYDFDTGSSARPIRFLNGLFAAGCRASSNAYANATSRRSCFRTYLWPLLQMGACKVAMAHANDRPCRDRREPVTGIERRRNCRDPTVDASVFEAARDLRPARKAHAT